MILVGISLSLLYPLLKYLTLADAIQNILHEPASPLQKVLWAKKHQQISPRKTNKSIMHCKILCMPT